MDGGDDHAGAGAVTAEMEAGEGNEGLAGAEAEAESEAESEAAAEAAAVVSMSGSPRGAFVGAVGEDGGDDDDETEDERRRVIRRHGHRDECTIITVFLQELLKFAFETPEHSRSLTHLPLSLCSPMAGFF